MRILSLRFKNINSLAGEWRIDFTAPKYEADGIFLITGPTGSGKTTILDAICLALYGKTPRQDRISSGANEVMPRSAQNCMSEVTFEANGVCYRSMWSHERKGRKGLFDTPKFRLDYADSGLQIETGEKGKEEIRKIIGMDFRQFTRAMLLAQGDFAAFLKSGPNERADILEQITGTGIYSEISAQAYRIAEEKSREIEKLKDEIANLGQQAGAEDPERLKELRAEYAEREKQLAAELAIQEERISWKKKLIGLEKEAQEIEGAVAALVSEEALFAGRRESLANAERAARAESAWVLVEASRNDLAGKKAELENLERKLPDLGLRLEDARRAAQEAQAAQEQAETIYRDCLEKLARARELDGRIAAKQQEKREQEARAEAEAKRLAEQGARLDELTMNLSVAGKREQELADWQATRAADADIAGRLPLLERDLAEIDRLRENASKKMRELEQTRTAAEVMAAKAVERERMLGAFATKENATQAELARLRESLAKILCGASPEELGAELERAEEERAGALIFRTQGVLDLRAMLVDDAPCPVCGALHHPFASGGIPQADELDGSIAALKKRVNDCHALERKINECEKALLGLESERRGLEGEKAEIDAGISASAKAANALLEEINCTERQAHGILADCVRLGAEFGLASDIAPADIAAALRGRLRDWQEKAAEKERVLALINRLRPEIAAVSSSRRDLECALAETARRVQDLNQEFAQIRLERQREFGDLDDRKASSLKEMAAKAKNMAGKAAEKEREAAAAHAAALADRERLGNELFRGETMMESRTRAFVEVCREEDFADENEFRRALLPARELKELREIDTRLTNRRRELETRESTVKDALEKERRRNLASADLDGLEAHRECLRASQKELLHETGRIDTLLEENAKRLELLRARNAELAALQADYEAYGELNRLIGSAKGDKFRKFAQGLTFELLVANANEQLARMNNRYILATGAGARSEGAENLAASANAALELVIIDNYRAGEARSASNLSGGESFIVSLALALAIASMGSRKMRIDSLFLDEGFGTLDEDTLETALATLESLRRQGKLIGLISHVAALRERIDTQIEVEAAGGGCSVLKGPGCARIAAPRIRTESGRGGRQRAKAQASRNVS